MPEKKEKGKVKRKHLEETLSEGRLLKRMTIIVPKDLKEPKTPGPTKTTKKENQS